MTPVDTIICQYSQVNWWDIARADPVTLTSPGRLSTPVVAEAPPIMPGYLKIEGDAFGGDLWSHQVSNRAIGAFVKSLTWVAQHGTATEGVPLNVFMMLAGRTKKQDLEELLNAGIVSIRVEHGSYQDLEWLVPSETVGIRTVIPRKGITPSLRTAVYQRDGHECLRCGATAALSVDHVIPVSKGGTDEMDNLQTLCMPCNMAKGARHDG